MDRAGEQNWAMWAHLGPLLVGLGGLLVSFGTLSIFAFVFPLVVMQTVGCRSQRVRGHAVESLNFQLSWLIYTGAALLLAIPFVLLTFGVGAILLFFLAIGASIVMAVLMIIAAVQASGGRFYRYPLILRLVR